MSASFPSFSRRTAALGKRALCAGRVLAVGPFAHARISIAVDVEFEPFDAVFCAGLSRHVDLLPGVAAPERRLVCHRHLVAEKPAPPPGPQELSRRQLVARRSAFTSTHCACAPALLISRFTLPPAPAFRAKGGLISNYITGKCHTCIISGSYCVNNCVNLPSYVRLAVRKRLKWECRCPARVRHGPGRRLPRERPDVL